MKITFATDADRQFIGNELIDDYEAQTNLNRQAGSVSTVVGTKHDAYSVTLVAWTASHDIIGFLKISNHPLDNRCSLDDVYVRKTYRRRGYGRKLTEYGIDYCRKSWPNIVSIYLFTIDGASVAEKLYKKLGFKNAGRYDNWLQDGRGQTLWQKMIEKSH